MDYRELSRLADEARKNSYCVYSKYSVGAALLTKGGKVYQGCNVENASYPAGICAERTAFSKAISEGESEFAAIAIAGGHQGDEPGEAFPCGVCRQFMNEFVEPDEFKVIIVHKGLDYSVYGWDEILPHSFGPKQLDA